MPCQLILSMIVDGCSNGPGSRSCCLHSTLFTRLGTSNLQRCSLLIGTRACFTGTVVYPAAIAPGVACGTVSSALSISKISAALDSMVVSLPRFSLIASLF